MARIDKKIVIIGKVPIKFKNTYNRLVSHPLQSWQWGEFREKTGVKVVRRGIFKNDKIADGFQLTIHKIPRTPWNIGYLPKASWPDNQVLSELVKIGKKHNCIFIKLEPNIEKSKVKSQKSKLQLKTQKFNLRKSSHPLFTKHTFRIDLTKSEGKLLKQMKSKTRYNVRLAQKKGVKVVEDNSKGAFDEYITLMKETTKRQKFYAHDEVYHGKMWEALYPAGIAHLLKAVYKEETLVIWIVFLFNGVLYYPYGASSNKHRNLMASNLNLWEAIRWGKKHGAKLFDLWGALGPNPDKADPHYGFHRFKKGYGGKLVELVGSYDLVLKPLHYSIYNIAHKIRWKLLRP
jgi:lipid II:glycine glycyltransferase (peptidoglycan interpeptide bridge formation enzyme)